MWAATQPAIIGPTMSSWTVTTTPRQQAAAGHAPPVVLAWTTAIVVGGVTGSVLGWWSRASVGSRSTAGVLAELGAPWIAMAFATGALARLSSSGRRPNDGVSNAVGSAVVGALAGAVCLVAATIVYYGPARTGRLDVAGAGSSAAVWAFVGSGIGVLFGALGALWWSAPTRRQAAACLVAVGTAITAEAYYLLDSGVAADPLVRNVLVGVAVAGAAVPLLLGLRWPAIAGIGLVGVLAVPVSLAAEVVSVGALDSIVHLRAYVSRL